MMTGSSLGVTIEGGRLILTWIGRGIISVQRGRTRSIDLPDNREELEEFVKWEVRDFVSAEGIKLNSVVVSVPRERAVMRLVELPEAVLANLDEAVSYEADKHIPLSGEETFGTHWVAGKVDKKVRVWLVRVKKEEISAVISGLRSAGVGVDAVEVSALSLWRLAEESVGKAGRVGVIDVRDGVAEVALFEQGELVYSRAQAGIPASEGERLRGLLESAQVSVGGEWVSVGADAVVVFGLPDLPDAEKVFGCERVVLMEGGRGVAEGAAMGGVDGERLRENNLLPAEMRARRRDFGVVVALGLLVVVMALFLGGYAIRIEKKKAALAVVEDRLANASEEYERASEIQRELETYLRRFKELEILNARRGVQAVDVVYELTRLLPPPVRVERLYLDGDEITLTGYEPQNTDVVPDLERSEYFRVTSPGSLTPRGNEKRFDNVKMRLVQ